MTERPGAPARWFGPISALGLATACADNSCEGRVLAPPPEPEPSASEPPTLIAGEWIGAGVLELSFSRPLSSVGDLDPARFAIVEFLATVDNPDFSDECYLFTDYRDLNGYYFYSGPSVAAAWIGPEDDTRLRLRLANTSAQCRTAIASVGSGILIAYTDSADDAAGTPLLDGDGDPVPDIGPAWAIDRLDNCWGNYYCASVNYFTGGHLPLLDSLVPIPCPTS